MIHITKINESFLRISGDYEDIEAIHVYFSRPAKNYWFHPKYKDGIWDGRIYFFKKSTGELPFGLFSDLVKCIKDNQIKSKIEPKLMKQVRDAEDIPDFEEYAFKNLNPKYLESLQEDVRDYQIKAAIELLKTKRGMFEHGTRSGKSLTSFLAVNYIFNKYFIDRKFDYKIIVVVPTTNLILEFVQNFIDYGIPEDQIGKYYAKVKDDTVPIIVGTWQSLKSAKHIQKKTVFAIGDECHGAKAVEINALLEKCTKAKIRIGMTGTLPSDPCDRMTITGNFGPVISVIRSKELIERGILVPPEIHFLRLHYPDPIKKKLKKIIRDYPEIAKKNINEKLQILKAQYLENKKQSTKKKILKLLKRKRNIGNSKTYKYVIEKKFIAQYPQRKTIARNIIKKHGDETKLFLFNEEKMGKDYLHNFEENFPDKEFRFVNGKIDADDREAIRIETNTKGKIDLVASLKTFAMGVTIPALSVIGFLWAGKSEITLPQAIGRGLTKCGTKEKLFIYDFADQLSYSKKHGDERIKIYMKQGFKVIIRDIYFK